VSDYIATLSLCRSPEEWKASSATGSLYRSPLTIMAQTIRASLLASAIAATLVGRRASKAAEPGPMFGAVDLGVTDDGERAGHEQAAQIAVTLFTDIAEPVLASARMLLRHKAAYRLFPVYPRQPTWRQVLRLVDEGD
jgi:hypothetical protein